MIRALVIIAMTGLLTSCGTFTPREIAEPSNVTLRQAVFDVATTLRDVQDVTPPGKKTGLMADEVTVVFNVAASSTTTNNANLTISNVPLAGGAVEGSAGTENVSFANRGNQVTIKFKNIATADMGKGIYSLKQFQTGGKSPPTGKSATEEKTDKTPEIPRNEANIKKMCEESGLCVMKKKTPEAVQ